MSWKRFGKQSQVILLLLLFIWRINDISESVKGAKKDQYEKVVNCGCGIPHGLMTIYFYLNGMVHSASLSWYLVLYSDQGKIKLIKKCQVPEIWRTLCELWFFTVTECSNLKYGTHVITEGEQIIEHWESELCVFTLCAGATPHLEQAKVICKAPDPFFFF